MPFKNAVPMKRFFKTRLYGIFLSGFIKNFQVTQAFLESKNIIQQFVVETIEEKLIFEHAYEKKVNPALTECLSI